MKNQDLAKLLLRITCGGILLFHGVHKVFVEVDHVKVMVKNAGLPESFAYGNIIGEFVAPIFVLLGLKTRLAALVIAFNMLMSVLIGHRDIMFSINDYLQILPQFIIIINSNSKQRKIILNFHWHRVSVISTSKLILTIILCRNIR